MGDTHRTEAPEQALRWYARAVDLGERLVALQPSDVQRLTDLLFYCDRAASLKEPASPEVARPWLQRGVAVARRLVGLDTSTGQRLALSRWLVRLGTAEATLGLPEAEASYREALAIREAVTAAEPEDPWDLVSRALWRLAERYLGQGKPEEERAYSERIHAEIERAAALVPENANVQYVLACTRARLGHTAKALAALSRSVALGNTDADGAAQDADLRSLRGLPEFEAILARMRDAATRARGV